MQDYYYILGLPQGASKDAVKKAYRQLAMRYHPDKNPTPEAKQKFILITEAYDNLLAGRAYAYTPLKSAPPKPATPPKPSYRVRDEKKREARQHAHQQLLRKLQDVRTYFHQPVRFEKERRKMHNKIYEGYAICGLVISASIIFPLFQHTPSDYADIANLDFCTDAHLV